MMLSFISKPSLQQRAQPIFSSGDDEDKRSSRAITDAEKQQLHLRAEKPPKRPSTSQLLTRTQQERDTLCTAVDGTQPSTGSTIYPTVIDLATEPDLPEIEKKG